MLNLHTSSEGRSDMWASGHNVKEKGRRRNHKGEATPQVRQVEPAWTEKGSRRQKGGKRHHQNWLLTRKGSDRNECVKDNMEILILADNSETRKAYSEWGKLLPFSQACAEGSNVFLLKNYWQNKVIHPPLTQNFSLPNMFPTFKWPS